MKRYYYWTLQVIISGDTIAIPYLLVTLGSLSITIA